MFSYKKHIALFFLVFFISTKLVSLHAFSHECENNHEEEECEICEYIITLNNTTYLIAPLALAEHEVLHNYNRQLFYKYSYEFTQNQIANTLFCRPPPIN